MFYFSIIVFRHYKRLMHPSVFIHLLQAMLLELSFKLVDVFKGKFENKAKTTSKEGHTIFIPSILGNSRW